MSAPATASNVTVLGRLGATRGLTMYFVLALAAPLLVALAGYQAYVRLQLPDVGLDVDSDLGVESVDARWSDVRQRDRIVALDGVRVRSTRDWMARSLAHREAPLEVTFEREGRQWTQSAQATPISAVDELAVWARIVTAATLMTMGLLTFLLRPGVAATWLMMLFSWDLGLFLLLKIGLWFDPRFYKQATIYPWGLMTSLGLHFLCYFPQRIEWITDKPVRGLWLYAPFALAPVVHALSLVTEASTVATLWAALAGVLVMAVVARQYDRVRRSGDERSRSQYRALLVGFTAGLLLPGLWNWLRISHDVWNGPWAAHYNALPLVLFVGVTSYAVVRHNALAIDRFTAAVVGYAATTLLLGAAFAGALLVIPLLLGTSRAVQQPVLLVVVTALTFAGFAPAYRRIKKLVDRRFFRERADATQIADALRELVLAMQQGTRAQAVQAVLDAMGILRADRTEIWLRSRDDTALQLERRIGAGVGTDVPIRLDGALGEALKQGLTGGVEEFSPRVFEAEAREELWSKELAMAAPVVVHGVLAGLLGVGRKRAGVGYQLEELSFLTVVAAQLGTVLHRWRGDAAQIDRYHLERRLGTGGMAEVFLAWQIGPGGFERKVALKRPLPHVSDDANAVAAFLDEARLAAQLRHPNIAHVYDVGESDGAYFLVMEYVDGPSLREVLRRMRDSKREMPVGVAAAIVVSILSALDCAHRHCDERGRPLLIVHRDITPRNVLLSRQGRVKLVDFGIARAQFQYHVTQTGTVKGTLPYMSPEQASGEELDQRSDVYSVGVLFYELLTGRAAYPDGPTPRRPARASTLVPDLPPALEPVLRRFMEHDASERYACAADAASAVIEAVAPAGPAGADEVSAFVTEMDPDATATTEGDRPPRDEAR